MACAFPRRGRPAISRIHETGGFEVGQLSSQAATPSQLTLTHRHRQIAMSEIALIATAKEHVCFLRCLLMVEGQQNEDFVLLMRGVCANPWQTYDCEWGFRYLWRWIDWVGRADIIALVLMLACVLFIVSFGCERYVNHRLATALATPCLPDLQVERRGEASTDLEARTATHSCGSAASSSTTA